jgi:hypothetical protein
MKSKWTSDFGDSVDFAVTDLCRLQMAVEALKPTPIVTDKKTNFWNQYKKLADEHDKEFLEKYSTDLDTSLIFVRLCVQIFSAAQSTTKGRSFLCRQLCIHYTNPARASTRPK